MIDAEPSKHSVISVSDTSWTLSFQCV
jgi:hypothetical protein